MEEKDTWLEICKDLSGILAKHKQDAFCIMGFCNGAFRNTVIHNASLEDTEHVQFLNLLSDRVNAIMEK